LLARDLGDKERPFDHVGDDGGVGPRVLDVDTDARVGEDNDVERLVDPAVCAIAVEKRVSVRIQGT